MEFLLSCLASAAALLWMAMGLLPWRPWGNREVLEAEAGAGAESLTDVTVLIPARDEAFVIGRTISSVKAQGGGVSIVLVDDGSTDGTAARAREAAGGDLRIVRGEPLPNGWSGKLWALEQGRSQVRTAYTLLLDADIELSPGMIGTLRRKIRADGIPFLSLMVSPPLGRFWERFLMPAFVFFFKVLYPFRLANSPASRVAAAAGGCILAETRLLESIGGFGPIRDALIDDCALAGRVKAAGNGTWIGLTRSARSIRPYGGLGEIWNMVARNAYTQLRYSVARLGAWTLAMTVAFWVPLVGLAVPSPAARGLSAVALIVMSLLYLPTVRFYGRSPAWAPCLPLAGTLFLAMTWTSAVRYWKGDRSRWKGRVYGRIPTGTASPVPHPPSVAPRLLAQEGLPDRPIREKIPSSRFNPFPRRPLMASAADFEKALQIGRPPNIQALFPNSRALIVSGKVVDRAMLRKGKAIAMAANGRSYFVVRGALAAAQRANAAVIIEIAKSEGGRKAYCAVNYWNIARIVDALCNEMGITIPVAIHADHYGIKNDRDLAEAKVEIPTLFEAGITSIAVDASHQADDRNLLANIAVHPFLPKWAGLETEVGEIKGVSGLSTVGEALFLVRGLNARGIFPDWIALNNGTTHGIEASDAGIQVELTAAIHEALAPYKVSGAQHGTSGNSSERLRAIAARTRTTKANVATALQMVSWGLEVNDYGNAQLDAEGRFLKRRGEGMTEELWAEMVAYADGKGWRKGDYKNLNLPFENRLLALPAEIRERMCRGVEEFALRMMTRVFNAGDTAPLALEAILSSGSFDPGPKTGRIEDPAEWTDAKIVERAKTGNGEKGAKGNFDD